MSETTWLSYYTLSEQVKRFWNCDFGFRIPSISDCGLRIEVHSAVKLAFEPQSALGKPGPPAILESEIRNREDHVRRGSAIRVHSVTELGGSGETPTWRSMFKHWAR
jgi:hypothetical protein